MKKRCPVGRSRNSKEYNEKNYWDCPITIQSAICKGCDKDLDTMSREHPLCELNWFVCPECYPRGCTALSHIDNETPTLGKVSIIGSTND